MQRPFLALWLASPFFYLGFQLLLPVMPPASAGMLARFWRRWFSTAAVYPSGLVLTLYVSYGGLAALLPLFTERRQLGNAGLFFTIFALMSLAVRSPAGRLSDRVGRRAVIAPALAIAAGEPRPPRVGRITGNVSRRGRALWHRVRRGTAGAPGDDRRPRPPGERGRAMGTLYTAWELGISGGSILLGFCVPRLGYTATWWTAAAISGLGAIATLRPGGRSRG